MAAKNGIAELQAQAAEFQARLNELQKSLNQLRLQLVSSNQAVADSKFELSEAPRFSGTSKAQLADQSHRVASQEAGPPPSEAVLAGAGDVDFGVGFHFDAPDCSWMRQVGYLLLPLQHIQPPALFSFWLTCSDERHYATFPFQLKVYLENECIRRVIFEHSYQSHEIQLLLRPAPGLSATIRLESAGNFVPCLLGLNADQRTLSVQLSRMRLRRMSGVDRLSG